MFSFMAMKPMAVRAIKHAQSVGHLLSLFMFRVHERLYKTREQAEALRSNKYALIELR